MSDPSFYIVGALIVLLACSVLAGRRRRMLTKHRPLTRYHQLRGDICALKISDDSRTVLYAIVSHLEAQEQTQLRIIEDMPKPRPRATNGRFKRVSA